MKHKEKKETKKITMDFPNYEGRRKQKEKKQWRNNQKAKENASSESLHIGYQFKYKWIELTNQKV